jgi:hypothetical protein
MSWKNINGLEILSWGLALLLIVLGFWGWLKPNYGDGLETQYQIVLAKIAESDSKKQR